MPIIIPATVEVSFKDGVLETKGPLGLLSRKVGEWVNLEIKEGNIEVSLKDSNPEAFNFWGLERALIANMVKGVSEGFVKGLEMVGVGFRARVEGEKLILLAGFSHPVTLPIPSGMKVTVSDETKIKVASSDKQALGQFCALVRKVRKPEPYKGKGIRYQGEVVRRKAGKAGKAGASAK